MVVEKRAATSNGHNTIVLASNMRFLKRLKNTQEAETAGQTRVECDQHDT